MPFKDPEKRKEYYKKWQKENRDKCNKNNQLYWSKLDDFEKKKKDWICNKKMKLRPGEDWESIYIYYTICDHCEQCGVRLTTTAKCKTNKNLDHDHSTGYVRAVVCWNCNINVIG